MKTKCVVLVGHGSTRASWRKPLESLRDDLDARLENALVCLAYLELCPPTVGDVLASAVADGYSTISILPMFMSSGGHVQRDLQPVMDELQAQYPTVELKMLSAFGELSVIRDALVSFLRDS